MVRSLMQRQKNQLMKYRYSGPARRLPENRWIKLKWTGFNTASTGQNVIALVLNQQRDTKLKGLSMLHKLKQWQQANISSHSTNGGQTELDTTHEACSWQILDEKRINWKAVNHELSFCLASEFPSCKALWRGKSSKWQA